MTFGFVTREHPVTPQIARQAPRTKGILEAQAWVMLGEALAATLTIDLPGQFMAKDGSSGMEASLTDVNFNASHNFNLISLTIEPGLEDH